MSTLRRMHSIGGSGFELEFFVDGWLVAHYSVVACSDAHWHRRFSPLPRREKPRDRKPNQCCQHRSFDDDQRGQFNKQPAGNLETGQIPRPGYRIH